MPFYKYTAMNSSGANTKGVVEAQSPDAAQDILAQRFFDGVAEQLP